MSDYVRVRDEDTGHTLSVPASAVPHGNYKVLKDAATNPAGEPLPPVHGEPKKPTVEPTSGHEAEPTKESK